MSRLGCLDAGPGEGEGGGAGPERGGAQGSPLLRRPKGERPCQSRRQGHYTPPIRRRGSDATCQIQAQSELETLERKSAAVKEAISGAESKKGESDARLGDLSTELAAKEEAISKLQREKKADSSELGTGEGEGVQLERAWRRRPGVRRRSWRGWRRAAWGRPASATASRPSSTTRRPSSSARSASAWTPTRLPLLQTTING